MGLFDKVKTSVTGLTEQQKYAVNIRQLSSQIDDNKNQIVGLTQQIGSRYVEKHIGEDDPEYGDLLSAIRAKREQIASLESEIEQLRIQQAAEEAARQQALQQKEEADRLAREQAREARNAQKAMRQAQPTFVSQAGETAQTYASQTVSVKYCPSCGRQNDEDAMFCIFCGKPFEAPETDQQTEE